MNTSPPSALLQFLNRASTSSGSEFACFVNLLQNLGIPYQFLVGGIEKKTGQPLMDQAGFGHLTSLATAPVRIGTTLFVFSSGAADYDAQEENVGPTGVFMFSYDEATKTVTPRTQHTDDRDMTAATGMAAIGIQHSFTPLH